MVADPKLVLVTGGTGYIGSHIVIELLINGFDVIIVDNLSNSKIEVVERISSIVKLPSHSPRLKFYKADLLNEREIENIFDENSEIFCVVHVAGLKSIAESVIDPTRYYNNNVGGTINLLKAMKKYSVNVILFSSSGMVYGEPKRIPIKETDMPQPINPYAKTKYMIEEILKDNYASDPQKWSVGILRYFNPAGAHSSGLIGEDPLNGHLNLVPCISMVALGKHEYVPIFGNDYPTRDGTPMRDYIHIEDLARGHVLALMKLIEKSCLFTYNLGTGKGVTVMEFLEEFQRVSKKKIEYKFVDRRVGDVSVLVSDSSLASIELNWNPIKSLEDICKDSWNWIKYLMNEKE